MLIRAFVVVLWLGLVSLPLSAQEAPGTPKAEVFGGFSIASPRDYYLYGWQASVAGHINSKFSLVGDIAGAYGSGGSSPDVSTYTFLGGPRWNVRGQRVSGFMHAMAGLTTLRGSLTGYIGPGSNAFAFAAGGGIDVKAGQRVWIRVIQLDVITDYSADAAGTGTRFGFGVVIPFGQR
jgi:hypothetical protein